MTYFIITIDTEEAFEWGKEFKTHYKEDSLSYIKELLKFQDICDKYKIKPTYLVDYPLLTNKSSLKILKQLKKRNCELGTHLHTWCNPPFEENITIKTTFAEFLPINLIEKKIKSLTNKFKEQLEFQPLSFKSGRYSINNDILNILIKNKYKIDTSFVPFTDNSSSGGSNKIITRCRPFKINSLLEIPATIGFNFQNFKLCNKNNLIIKILKKLNIIKKIKLSPENNSVKDMKKIINIFLKKKVPVIHFEFHSSDFKIEATPYVKNKKELRKFYKSIESILKYTKKLNLESVGASEVKI